MLADRYLKPRYQEGYRAGRELGKEPAAQEYLTADSQRRAGETLQQAVERLRQERTENATRRNSA